MNLTSIGLGLDLPEGWPQGPELLGPAAIAGKTHRSAEDNQPWMSGFLAFVLKEDGDRATPMPIASALFGQGIAT